MTSAKGLIYKEFILQKKTLLMTALTWLIFFTLVVSVCISLHHGNLAGNPSFTAKDAVKLSYAVAACTMLSLINGGRTVFGDAKCHWDIFECTLPVSVQKKAAVRIFMLGAASITALSVSLLSAWVIYRAAHQPFALNVFKNMVLLMLVCLMITVCAMAIMLKYKDPQAAGVRLFSIFAAIYLLTAIWSFIRLSRLREQLAAMTEEELLDDLLREIAGRYTYIRDLLFPFSPLIFALTLLLGYFLFAALNKNRTSSIAGSTSPARTKRRHWRKS